MNNEKVHKVLTQARWLGKYQIVILAIWYVHSKKSFDVFKKRKYT